MMSTPTVICSGVSLRGRSIPRGSTQPFSLTIGPSEFVGVLTTGNLGRSLLLKALAGLRPFDGRILINGRSARSTIARRTVGLAFDPPMLPRMVRVNEWLGYVASHAATTPRMKARVLEWAIDVSELSDLLNKRCAMLGREGAARVAIAGALIRGSSLVLIDGPIDQLNVEGRNRLIARLWSGLRAGASLVIASTNTELLERTATRVLVMRDGRCVGDMPTADLLGQRILDVTFAVNASRGRQIILETFAGSRLTEAGVTVPLSGGLGVESFLAFCHDERVAVARTRVRSRRLDDLLCVGGPDNASGIPRSR